MGKLSEKLMYVAGDIMLPGSRWCRQNECDRISNLNLPINLYSPVLNKSINAKTSVTEEENNHLAEKIVKEDCDRLDRADFVMFSAEQHAVGTLVEIGYILGRKSMASEIFNNLDDIDAIKNSVCHAINQKTYFHYADLRATDIKESGFRRSFGINQFLYGAILKMNLKGIQTLDEIEEDLVKELGE